MELIKIELFWSIHHNPNVSILNFSNYQKIDNILTKINLDQYISNYSTNYLIKAFSLEKTCIEVIFSIELAVK